MELNKQTMMSFKMWEMGIEDKKGATASSQLQSIYAKPTLNQRISKKWQLKAQI